MSRKALLSFLFLCNSAFWQMGSTWKTTVTVSPLMSTTGMIQVTAYQSHVLPSPSALLYTEKLILCMEPLPHVAFTHRCVCWCNSADHRTEVRGSSIVSPDPSVSTAANISRSQRSSHTTVSKFFCSAASTSTLSLRSEAFSLSP